MSYAAKVICDSISPNGVRLVTMEVTLPRLVLAEFNTHRAFSRNSASSRAIPIPKRIGMVLENPYVPDEFGSNRAGMQSGDPLEGEQAEQARTCWLRARDAAVEQAKALAELGVHKEYANRLLEPFLWHTIVVTSTEWENYFALRTDSKASRPIRIASEMMVEAVLASEPRPVNYGEWHLPYVDPDELFDLFEVGRLSKVGSNNAVKVSCARCARVSYLTHDGKRDPKEDLRLYDRLLTSGHMSPFEHAARPARPGDVGRVTTIAGEMEPPALMSAYWFGNFRGWFQHRKELPNEAVFQNGDARRYEEIRP